MKYLIKLTILCCLPFLLMAGCSQFADMTGNSTASINAQSAELYAKVKNDAKAKRALVTDHRLRRVEKIVNELKPYANQANKTGVPFAWEVIVLNSKEVNAWCMPGGKIAVYTGLLEQLKLNDTELATVLGHEMSHALKEHSKQQQTLSTGLNIGIAVLGMATNQTAQDIGSVVANLGASKFSRSEEIEADTIGLRLIAQAGYNPEKAPSIWEKFKSLGGSQSGLVNLFSTHPTDDARIKNFEKLMPEAIELYKVSKQKKL